MTDARQFKSSNAVMSYMSYMSYSKGTGQANNVDDYFHISRNLQGSHRISNKLICPTKQSSVMHDTVGDEYE